jgi:hypothetical protein
MVTPLLHLYRLLHMPALSRYSATAVVLALVSACSSDSNSPRDPARFISASVAANPHNTISAVVTVTASGYDSALVGYIGGSGAVRTPAFAFAGTDTVLTVPVLGLDTVTAYDFTVLLFDEAGDTLSVDSLPFTTGGLPAWIPLASTAGTAIADGYVLLSYPNGPVIIDNAGKVVWYRFQPGGVLGSWMAHPNGEYTWLGQADSSGYYVFDVLGNEVGRHSCQGFNTRFHDVLITAAGERWMMCDEVDTLDLSADSGSATASVTSTVVQHFSADGNVDFQWRALDHFAITDAPLDTRTGSAVNFTHSNAIALDTDGNLLLSSRTLNEVTKINSTTGEVIWRFGGEANEFTIAADTKGFFEQQHGLRPVGPNVIQFLDNGRSAPSRVVRYTIDPVTHSANLVWQFTDAPITFTVVGGSTQVYSNGGGLVSFGREGRVVEFNSAGTKSWEVTGIDDIYVFRAQRIQSLYAPGVGDPP